MAKLELDSLKRYAEAFPLAYYAGRKIKMAVDLNSDMSYANVTNDNIVISLKQVNAGLAKVNEVNEKLVRPLCYHEVSHVILTPADLFSIASDVTYTIDATYPNFPVDIRWSRNNVVNIIEDERIERRFDKLYMDCDFFDNVLRICDYQGRVLPKSWMTYLFQVVRFHEKTDMYGLHYHDMYVKSRQLILKHINLSRNATYDQQHVYATDMMLFAVDIYNDYMAMIKDVLNNLLNMPANQLRQLKAEANKGMSISLPKITEYSSDMQSLIEKVNERLKQLDQQNAPSAENGLQDGGTSGMTSADKQPDKKETGSSQDNSMPDGASSQGKQGGKQAGDGSGTPCEDSSDGSNEEDDSEIKSLEKHIEDKGSNVEESRKLFKQIVFNAGDSNVRAILERKALKQQVTDAQAAATHKYSGRLQSKSVGRDDWKIFIRRTDKSEGAKLGKRLHLILVLDQSGSYSHNDAKTNEILKALADFEKNNVDFEFDMIKFNTGWYLCKKDERQSSSCGGTYFEEDMFKQIEKLKRPDMLNYVIMLNDGEATCPMNESFNVTFKKVMDSKNAAIIVDRSFSKFYTSKLKKPKIIVTSDYPKELSKNVCDILNEMFA